MASLGLDIHLGLQCFLYLMMPILGLTVAVPLVITYANFNNRCMLYGEFTKRDSLVFYQGSQLINCKYPVGVGVSTGIIYGLIMTVVYVRAMVKGDEHTGSRMSACTWLPLFLNSIKCVGVFVSSCMISVGFKTMCDSLEAAYDFRCSLGQELITWNKKSPVNGASYYTCFKIAEISSWILFLVMAAQVSLGVLRVYRNHRTSREITARYDRFGSLPR